MTMHSYQPTTYTYQPSTPRFAFGLAAAAITAVMLSIFVIVPASADAQAQEPAMVAMSLRCSAGL
jgi:hypothetical protein